MGLAGRERHEISPRAVLRGLGLLLLEMREVGGGLLL